MTFTRSPSHRSDENPGAGPRPTRAVQRRRLATRRREHGPWAHHPAPPGGRRVAASAARRPSRLPTKASRRTPGTDGPRTSRAPCDAARVRWSLTGRRSWGGAWSSSVTSTFARRTGCEPSPVQMEPYGPVSRRHHHSHRDRPAVVADDLDLEALARLRIAVGIEALDRPAWHRALDRGVRAAPRRRRRRPANLPRRRRRRAHQAQPRVSGSMCRWTIRPFTGWSRAGNPYAGVIYFHLVLDSALPGRPRGSVMTPIRFG
jgi:hypothetical protein